MRARVCERRLAARQTGQNASLEIIIERMVQAGLPPTQASAGAARAGRPP